jgi:hypothetical protein
LKASIPYVHANSNKHYDIRHLAAFPAAAIQLKKPSVARRAYRSPMPWRKKSKKVDKMTNLFYIDWVAFTKIMIFYFISEFYWLWRGVK